MNFKMDQRLTDSIAPISNNGWAWERAIDSQDNSLNAIGSSSSVLDIEPIFASDSCIGYGVVVIR